MNKIFEEYAKKYIFLNNLSEREKSIIICMMYEQQANSLLISKAPEMLR